MKWVLKEFRENGAYSFVSVLKKLGGANSSPLSFAYPGWCLSLDIANNSSKSFDFLEKVDRELNSIGGKIYLAKDSRMSPNIIKNSHPNIDKFFKCKKSSDPDSKFASELSKRLFGNF